MMPKVSQKKCHKIRKELNVIEIERDRSFTEERKINKKRRRRKKNNKNE